MDDQGRPKAEHNQADQFASIPRGNANFAWVQPSIYHIAPFFWINGTPQGGFTRGDRRHVLRVNKPWSEVSNALAS